MTLTYSLTKGNTFDLRKNSQYVREHKGGIVAKTATGVTRVAYKAFATDSPSPGFRIELETTPNQTYLLTLKGKLRRGDVAFLYIESRSPTTRLHPRDKYMQNQDIDQAITFTAISETTYVGILFYSHEIDYVLDITNFTIVPHRRVFTNSNVTRGVSGSGAISSDDNSSEYTDSSYYDTDSSVTDSDDEPQVATRGISRQRLCTDPQCNLCFRPPSPKKTITVKKICHPVTIKSEHGKRIKIDVDGTVCVQNKPGDNLKVEVDGPVGVTGTVGIDGQVDITGTVGIDGPVGVTGTVCVKQDGNFAVETTPGKPIQVDLINNQACFRSTPSYDTESCYFLKTVKSENLDSLDPLKLEVKIDDFLPSVVCLKNVKIVLPKLRNDNPFPIQICLVCCGKVIVNTSFCSENELCQLFTRKDNEQFAIYEWNFDNSSHVLSNPGFDRILIQSLSDFECRPIDGYSFIVDGVTIKTPCPLPVWGISTCNGICFWDHDYGLEITGSELMNCDTLNDAVFNIPFPFNYFGTTYDSICLCTNGKIVLGNCSVKEPLIPDDSGSEGIVAIAPLAQNLDLSVGGQLYYKVTEDQLTVTWIGVPCEGACGNLCDDANCILPGTNTFQVTIDENGNLCYKYLNVTQCNNVTVGIFPGDDNLVEHNLSCAQDTNVPLNMNQGVYETFGATKLVQSLEICTENNDVCAKFAMNDTGTIVVSNPFSGGNLNPCGSVCVYARISSNGCNCNQPETNQQWGSPFQLPIPAKITNCAGIQFGSAIAVSHENRIIVGAKGISRAFIYRKNPVTCDWEYEWELNATVPQGSNFGETCDISDGFALVGEPNFIMNNNMVGRAHLFTLTPNINSWRRAVTFTGNVNQGLELGKSISINKRGEIAIGGAGFVNFYRAVNNQIGGLSNPYIQRVVARPIGATNKFGCLVKLSKRLLVVADNAHIYLYECDLVDIDLWVLRQTIAFATPFSLDVWGDSELVVGGAGHVKIYKRGSDRCNPDVFVLHDQLQPQVQSSNFGLSVATANGFLVTGDCETEWIGVWNCPKFDLVGKSLLFKSNENYTYSVTNLSRTGFKNIACDHVPLIINNVKMNIVQGDTIVFEYDTNIPASTELIAIALEAVDNFTNCDIGKDHSGVFIGPNIQKRNVYHHKISFTITPDQRGPFKIILSSRDQRCNARFDTYTMIVCLGLSTVQIIINPMGSGSVTINNQFTCISDCEEFFENGPIKALATGNSGFEFENWVNIGSDDEEDNPLCIEATELTVQFKKTC